MGYEIELVILGATIWAALYFYFTRNFNHWKAKNVKFIKPVPFFGNILDGILLRNSPGVMLADIYKKYAGDKYVGLFLLDQPCLLIRDPKLIKEVLVTNFQSFYNRVTASNYKDDPIGSNIMFIIMNPEWRDIRTNVTPAFTTAKMKNMHTVIQESAAAMLDYVKRVAKNDSVIETKELTAKFTTDVIISTSFGVKANCFEEENAPFRLCSRKLFDWTDLMLSLQMRCYFLAPMLVKLFRMRLLKGECTKFLKETFSRIMNERQASGTTRNDLIDILLQLQSRDKKFRRDKLVAQAVQFFVAGSENSSTAMSFAFYELAKNQDVQDKLRLEINEFYEKHHDFTYDVIKQMTYLNLVMKETLRKYPPIPFIQRGCNIDYKIPDSDIVIQKGTTVFVSTLGLHYDPEYYHDPEKFIPERFMDYNTKNHTYLPFSDGPRNCMGYLNPELVESHGIYTWCSARRTCIMFVSQFRARILGERFAFLSTKLGLAYILRNFKVEICDQTNTNIQFEPKGLLLAPIGGVLLNYKALNV